MVGSMLLGKESMNALVTGDLQFSDNPRDAYRFKIFNTLHRLIKKYNITLLILLGDLTEAKNNHSAWLVNTIVDQVCDLAKVCKVICLTGNHDYTEADNPFFEFLRHVEHIEWISAPTSYSALKYDEVAPAVFLPHTHNPKRDWQGMRKFIERARWTFAHQTFQGAIAAQPDKGIPLDIFPEGVRVISGDVHEPTRIGPVTYAGAPYLVDFGDNYKPRVLMLSGAKKLSIPLGGPQKRLVELDSISNLDKITGVNAGDILKVRVCVNMADHAKWHEYQKRVRDWGAEHNILINAVHPIVVGHKVDASIKNKIRDVKSDAEVLTSYGKQRGIDARTLKAGLQIVEE